MKKILSTSGVVAAAVFLSLSPTFVPSTRADVTQNKSGEIKDRKSLIEDPEWYDLQWIEEAGGVKSKAIFTDERMPGKLPKSTRAASAITNADQDWSLAPTIAEPMPLEAGVSYKRRSAGDLIPIIRGLGGKGVAVYLDEFRLDSPALPRTLAFPLAAVDPFMTMRTEIVRGPSPIFHGGQATAGVIHILSQRRLQYDNISSFNSHALGRFSTAAQEMSGHMQAQMNLRQSLGIFAGVSARNLEDSPSAKQEYAADVHADNFSANADLRLGGRIVASAAHQHLRLDHVPSDPGDPADRDHYRRWDMSSVSLTMQNLARAMRYAKITAGYMESSHLSQRPQFDADFRQRCMKAKVQGYFTDAVIDMPAGRYFSFIYGGEFRSDFVESDASERRPDVPDGAVYQRPAFFLSVKALPMKRLKILPGIRVESANVKADIQDPELGDPELEYAKTALGYGVSGRLQTGEFTSLFGGYQYGFNFPTLAELAGQGKTDTIYYAPQSDLDPEIVQTAELGFRLSFPFAKGQFTMYESRLSDMIAPVPSQYDGLDKIDNAQVYASQNAGEGGVRGFEADIRTWLGINWDFGLGFSAQSGADGDDRAFLSSPPFMGSAHLRWTNDTQIISLETATRFAGEQSKIPEQDLDTAGLDRGDIPGYMTLDLRMGLAIGRYIDLKLGAINVTGSEVIHSGSRIPEPKQNFITQMRLAFY